MNENNNGKVDISSCLYSELEAMVLGFGEKKYRAKQIYSWLHQKNVSDFDEMTNLSKSLIGHLKEECEITKMVIETSQSSADGTVKFLFKLWDGQYIETVLMRYEHGNSICISTQAGCRMGCTFCASGLLGLNRNLTTGEMLTQIYMVEKAIEGRVSNVVLMGTGEPLDNYDNVINFIKIAIDHNGKNISARHITLSTCGLVDQIDRLGQEGFQITLAISLHATTDEVRAKTMPIAKKYSIEQILCACEDYFSKKGRRISFEYGLIKGVNDSKSEAVALAKLLHKRNFKCHVNLIPINNVSESNFVKSDRSGVYQFRDVLLEYNVEATVRRSLGGDIDAACGQLRLRVAKDQQ